MSYFNSDSGDMLIIGDHNWQEFVEDPTIDGEKRKRGLKPRNYQTHPIGFYGAKETLALDIPLIPEGEWVARLADMEASQSSLTHIRDAGAFGQQIPSRDQNGKGYCHPAGTSILMADGTSKPIEAVAVGDSVLGSSGQSRAVTDTFRRRYSGEVRTLYSEGGAKVSATAEHPFAFVEGVNLFGKHRGFVENGVAWSIAGDIKAGDLIYRGGDPRHAGLRLVEGAWSESAEIDVFNFEVKDDHSYYAGGILSHNCWAHSGVSANLLLRARDNQPYVDLSAYAIACIIKGYQDEGGWGAEGLDWQVENGCPSSEFWAQQSMSRSNDNAAMRANAKLHRIIEGWVDLNSAQYDRNLTWAQQMTMGLSRNPLINDYNWWSHSVCGVKPINGAGWRNKTRAKSGKLMSLKQFEAAWGMNHPITKGMGYMVWNSWGNSWSAAGMGPLTGSKAIPDGCTAPRVSAPSVN